MERLSLDSSVAIKWFNEEEDTDKALKIRNAHVNGNMELVVSHMLFYEVVNALRYKPDFNVTHIKRAINALFKLHMKISDFNERILERSSEIAFNENITVYDAIPVAIAEKEKTLCVTADEKTQYNRLKGRYPIILLKECKI